MRAPAVALSAAVHLVLVALLGISGGDVRIPVLVDIELAPRVAIEPVRAVPPPAMRQPGAGGTLRPIAPAAAPRPLAVRSVDRPVARAAPPPRAVSAELAEPAVPVAPSEPSSDEPSSDGGDAAGGGGGDGDLGSGRGEGPGTYLDIDRSMRAVPIDGTAPRTLPYTAEAARERVSGDVLLELTVDPLGRVGRVTVRRGLGHGLDEVATRLAMQIRFRPATDRSGTPTVAKVRWRFHFEPP